MKFQGKVKIWGKDENGDFTKLLRESPNLWVDDGKELTLDFLWGLQSWWNPLDQGSYDSGNIGWGISRFVGVGECMFNNSSFERASGTMGIPSGTELSYPVESTFLVSPEDSFLSNEIGNRVEVECIRRDQTVEISAILQVPSDIPSSTYVREFGMFLASSGPAHDPSGYEPDRPNAMICRSALYDTGWYNEGGPCNEEDSGATFCYIDDPYFVDDDIRFTWIFGEL